MLIDLDVLVLVEVEWLTKSLSTHPSTHPSILQFILSFFHSFTKQIEYKSKRQTLRLRYGVQKKVQAHKKKMAKLAKKHPQLIGTRKSKKDPGIPNLWPFKEEMLEKMKQDKEKLEEEKIKEKQARASKLERKKIEERTKNFEAMERKKAVEPMTNLNYKGW